MEKYNILSVEQCLRDAQSVPNKRPETIEKYFVDHFDDVELKWRNGHNIETYWAELDKYYPNIDNTNDFIEFTTEKEQTFTLQTMSWIIRVLQDEQASRVMEKIKKYSY